MIIRVLRYDLTKGEGRGEEFAVGLVMRREVPGEWVKYDETESSVNKEATEEVST